MSRDSRRIFSSAEYLGRFTPALLVKFAHRHPEDFGSLIASGAIPCERDADKLDLAALVPLLTSSGISDGLADALYLINALATPKHRRLLESEVARRQVNLPTVAAESTADYVLRVWLHDRTIIEAAAARASLISRRSFAYFIPASPDIAASMPRFNASLLETMTAKIRANLGPKGRGRGLTIIPYLDSPQSDWFLIRRSRLPERITIHNEVGAEEHKSVWFRVYDVVVFDRLTGVLKVNCREKIEDVYRTAFGTVLAGDMYFFEDRSLFTLNPLRSADVNTLHCRDIASLAHVALEQCFFDRYRHSTLMRESISTHDWYAVAGGTEAPIPANAEMSIEATMNVTFTDSKRSTKCNVRQGNRLSFGRDEHAALIEEFLIKRGFMQHVNVIRRDIAA
jgi:hypothetical protein